MVTRRQLTMWISTSKRVQSMDLSAETVPARLPTSVEISMFGYAGKDLSKVRSRVGCLIEAPGVYPNMTAKENIEMKCRLFGISKKGYAEVILDKVGL